MTRFDNVEEFHHDWPCDEFDWNFGNDQYGSERNPVVIFPNTGGSFDVKLTAMIAEGRCENTKIITINLPSIGDTTVYTEATICEGDYIQFGPQFAGEERVYVNVWKSVAGCDSTVYLDLHLSPQSTMQTPDTIICADEPLIIDGQKYKSTESGKFYRFYKNINGCDSTLWCNVTVLDSILPEVTVRQMTDEPNSGAIFIDGKGFEYYTVNGGYPQTADSITGLNGGMFELEFFSSLDDVTCSVVVEANVSVCMPGWVYQRWDDVLSLKNFSALETDSVTHIFENYQWFKDNEPIEGANLSYLYVNGGLDPEASYHLEMTRVHNGETVVTCPFRPVREEDRVVVYVYPSPVQSGGKLTIMVSAPAMATIVNTFGDVVTTIDLKEGANEVVMNVPAGLYVVQVTIGGETRVCRVGVID